MCGSRSRLKACHFHAEIGQGSCLTLLKLIVDRIGSLHYVTRECQRVAEYQICGRCADVGLQCRSDCKKRKWELPEPVLGLIVAESYQSFLEASMQAFY